MRIGSRGRGARLAAVVAGAAAVVGTAGLSTASAAPATAKVPGNVPSFATSAHRTGPVATASKLTVSVYLTPHDPSALSRLAHDVSTPGTSSYRHYLTPAEFHDRFSPSQTTVDAVKAFLRGAGLTVNSVASNRMYVDATGTVAQVEKAFHVTQETYRVQGQDVRSNAEAPQIPSSLAGAITFVGGLDATQTLVRPAAAPPLPIAPTLPCNGGDQSTTVTIPDDTGAAQAYGSTQPFNYCGYTPQQLQAAYGVGRSGLTGAGVTVGVVDAFASPTEPSDLDTFSADHDLPAPDFTQLTVPGTFHYPENTFDPAGWYGEESLDLVAVHAMAPAAKIVYAGAQNSEVPLDHALERLIDGHLADVVTDSWGYTGEVAAPGHYLADEIAFEQAALEGISVLFSSGDDGDVGALTGLAQASYPASSPWVTAVGGTSLLAQERGSYDEYGWGTYFANFDNPALSPDPDPSTSSYNLTADSLPWPPEFYGGSGGGVSRLFAQPDYQQGQVNGLGTSAAVYGPDGPTGDTVTYSAAHRVVPDVAMDGDPYTGMLFGETYTTSSFGPDNENQDGSDCTPSSSSGRTEYCEEAIGGTSLASPLFAGVLALVDQARRDAGLSAVGFLNPTLYGSGGAGLRDIGAPDAPLGFVRTRQTPSGLSARFVTVNSAVDGASVVEGADTTLRTGAGYDDVTGLGTPDVPALVAALGPAPARAAPAHSARH